MAFASVQIHQAFWKRNLLLAETNASTGNNSDVQYCFLSTKESNYKTILQVQVLFLFLTIFTI